MNGEYIGTWVAILLLYLVGVSVIDRMDRIAIALERVAEAQEAPR